MYKIADNSACITHLQARDTFLTYELWGNLPSIKHSLESNSGGYVESNQVKYNTWVQLDWVNDDTV
jgi:hypothetical protein